MADDIDTRFDRLTGWVRRALGRVDMLALFPLLTLVCLWLEFPNLAFAVALILPALLALQAFGHPPRSGVIAQAGRGGVGASERLTGQAALLARLDEVSQQPDRDTACILIQIDDWDTLQDRWGNEAAQDIANRVYDRLRTTLRLHDLVERLGDARFGIVLDAQPSSRLGVREGVVTRLRGSIGEAIAVSGGAAHLTSCAGHTALVRSASDPARATFAAAETALAEAHLEGPDAVRAYAPGLTERRKIRNQLTSEVEAALEQGQIKPWFQPQICADTGMISGFEALARWHHPVRGVLTPRDFLQAVEDAGRMEGLGHTILFHALSALQAWDEAGLRVPSVSVNFSPIELRNPGLVDRVKWEVDRFDMRPARLTVEILETVVASNKDDTITATLTALGAHGVNLDLDDFGIGQASLSSIRQFGVSRIKIDRSFILGMDTDPEQRSMVAAIIAMAQHLGVETLAEGVETEIVQSILTEMGCNHVQGFFIARPMPFEDSLPWAAAHTAAHASNPETSRRIG